MFSAHAICEVSDMLALSNSVGGVLRFTNKVCSKIKDLINSSRGLTAVETQWS